MLDPFCGCGTAVHAAQKLGRQWIGIDITHLAISLIERRLKDAFPGIAFEVHGTPKDLDGARDLARRDKYQFQWWAVSLIDAQPYAGKKKGADSGIDGLIYFKLRRQDDRARDRERQGRRERRRADDPRSQRRLGAREGTDRRVPDPCPADPPDGDRGRLSGLL